MSSFSFTLQPNNPNEDSRTVWEARNNDPTQSSDSKDDLLRVIGTITDLEAWQKLKDLHSNDAITPSSPGQWIVTTHVTKSQLAYLRNLPFVVTLEQGRKVWPAGVAEPK